MLPFSLDESFWGSSKGWEVPAHRIPLAMTPTPVQPWYLAEAEPLSEIDRERKARGLERFRFQVKVSWDGTLAAPGPCPAARGPHGARRRPG